MKKASTLTEDDSSPSLAKSSGVPSTHTSLLDSCLEKSSNDAPLMSKENSVTEVQRLLQENAKLLQEKKELQQIIAARKVEEDRDRLREGSSVPAADGKEGALKPKEPGSSTPSTDEEELVAKRKKKEEELLTAIALLEEKVKSIESQKKQLQEAFSTSSLVYVEREHLFGQLYSELKVELEAVREEKNDLRVALLDAEERVAKAKAAAVPAATTSTSSLPLSRAHTATTGSTGVHSDVHTAVLLERLQQEIHDAFDRVVASAGVPSDAHALRTARKDALSRPRKGRSDRQPPSEEEEKDRRVSSAVMVGSGRDEATGNGGSSSSAEENHSTEWKHHADGSHGKEPKGGYDSSSEVGIMPRLFREEFDRQRQAVLSSTSGLHIPKGAASLRAASPTSSKTSVKGAKASLSGQRKRGRPRSTAHGNEMENASYKAEEKNGKGRPEKGSPLALRDRSDGHAAEGTTRSIDSGGAGKPGMSSSLHVEGENGATTKRKREGNGPSHRSASSSCASSASRKGSVTLTNPFHGANMMLHPAPSKNWDPHPNSGADGALPHREEDRHGSREGHTSHPSTLLHRTSTMKNVSTDDSSATGTQESPHRTLSMEKYIYRACRTSPPPTSAARLRDQHDVLRTYHFSNWTAMASDVQTFLLKAARHPSALSSFASHGGGGVPENGTDHASSSPPTTPAAREALHASDAHFPSHGSLSGALFSVWSSFWNGVSSSSMEDTIWRLLHVVVPLNESQLVPALQRTFSTGLLALMSHGVQADGGVPVKARGSDDSVASTLRTAVDESTMGKERHRDGTQAESLLSTKDSILHCSTALRQMHALATALNFLWLQQVGRVMSKTTGQETSEDTHPRQAGTANASSSSSLSSLSTLISTIHEHIVQLLMDTTVVALHRWRQTPISSLSFPSSPVPSTVSGSEAKGFDVHLGNLFLGKATQPVQWPAGLESRWGTLQLWMTCWRALLGRTAPRHQRLLSFLPPSHVLHLYDRLFIQDVVVPSIGWSDFLLAWHENRPSPPEKEEEEGATTGQAVLAEEARSGCPVSPSLASSFSSFSSFSFPPPFLASSSFHSHGVMVYAIKAIMAACLRSVTEETDFVVYESGMPIFLPSSSPFRHISPVLPTPTQAADAKEPMEKRADGSFGISLPTSHHQGDRTPPLPPEEDGTKQRLEIPLVWLDFTSAVGWSVGTSSVDEMTHLAVRLAVGGVGPAEEASNVQANEEGKEDSRTWGTTRSTTDSPPSRRTAEDVASAERKEGGETEREDEGESNDHGEAAADETVAESSSTVVSLFAPPPLSALEQAQSLLKWETENGAALSALRLIVFFKGFNYIASVVQPFIQAELYPDEREKKPTILKKDDSTHRSVRCPSCVDAHDTHSSTSCTSNAHRGDDLMAYILSSAVMDFRVVVEGSASQLTPPFTSSPTSLSSDFTASGTATAATPALGPSSSSSAAVHDVEHKMDGKSDDNAHSSAFVDSMQCSGTALGGFSTANDEAATALGTLSSSSLLPGNGKSGQEATEKAKAEVSMVAVEERSVPEPTAYARVLEFLHEYILTTTLRPPSRTPISFDVASTVQIFSVAGIIQLLSEASCSSAVIQHYLSAWRTWLRTAIRKFAAKKGLAVSEDAKALVPGLVPKDSVWCTRTGKWILEVFLP